MSILSVMQDVSLVIGAARPTAVFASTDREWQELQVVANEAAAVISRAFDWQRLIRTHTLTGNAASGSFAMPADYGRMPVKANLWSSRYRWAMNQIVSFDHWLELVETGHPLIEGNWIIFGDEMHVRPVMMTGETCRFFYITRNIVRSDSAVPKAAFSNDGDTFVLDERLLKLAIIYLWKQGKGLDFAAELADFEQAMNQDMKADRGSQPVVSGSGGLRGPSRNVWPGLVSG